MRAIDINEQLLADRDVRTLESLLSDKTTGGYLRWSTDAYAYLGKGFTKTDEMMPGLVTGHYAKLIRPRIAKSEEEKRWRTKDRAEVFTPAWVCNEQNNLVDLAWFGRDPQFNIEMQRGWKSLREPIAFDESHTWQGYVDRRVLEITCGEAPYITTRYDVTTGKIIPLPDRVGLLDRKIRVLSENASDDREWLKWAKRAVESCYAYDYQGDNVLLARENVLAAVEDAYEFRFGESPSASWSRKVATVVSWNIFQMDGFTYTAPHSNRPPAQTQLVLDDVPLASAFDIEPVPCLVYDWRARKAIEFRSFIRRDEE